MSDQNILTYKSYPLLFIDDEEHAVTGFVRQFKNDFRIFTAANGKDALELLQIHPEITIIISDQRMPGMSGIETLHQAMLLRPDTVRILMTAYTEMKLVIDAINTGNVYRYITKPFDEDNMRLNIRQAIEWHSLNTERDRLYKEKIETMKKVARTNRMAAVGVLAAGMAHEINNPLVAISTFLQMLPEKMNESKKDSEYFNKFYTLALKETHRIQSLIRHLLNYSKTSAAYELTLTQNNLNELVQEIMVLLTREAKKKENHLEMALAPDLPLGKMDGEKIKQVLFNLGLNAIHATKNGKIKFSTSHFQDKKQHCILEIKLSDTGCGIPTEDLEKLFNVFFTTKENEGSGLGLVTCHHILDAHRGNIDIQSKVGQGTIVTVQIPVDPMTYERRNSVVSIDS
ncbi:MAG: sensor histidine kinase [Nitrospiria bacterium]